MNKKGSTMDIMVGIVVLFLAGIVFLVTSHFFNAISESSIADLRGNISGAPVDIIGDFGSYTLWTFDFILIMAFVGFFFGAIILAAFARHHPVMAWVNVIILIILIMISVPLSNSYADISDYGALGETAGTIAVFNFLMQNLPWLMIIFGAFLLLAMFAFKSGVTAI